MPRITKPQPAERNPYFDAEADLRRKCAALVEIVEGVTSVRWAHNAHRLKDTPEWAAFYVAANRANSD